MIPFVYILLFTAMIYRYKALQANGLKKIYAAFYFILKCAAGWAFYIFYKRYYGYGDIFIYQSDAVSIYELHLSNPSAFWKIMFGVGTDEAGIVSILKGLDFWYDAGFDSGINDTRTVIRFLVVVQFINLGSDFADVVFMNIASYTGLVMIWNFFSYSRTSKMLRMLPFLLPSVLLWGSCIFKETLLLLSIGLLLHAIRKWQESGPVFPNILLLLLAIYACVIIKIYYFLFLLPGLLVFLPSFRLPQRDKLIRLTFVYLFFVLCSILIGFFPPYLSVPDLLYGEQRNMWKWSIYCHAGSIIHPLGFAPNWISLFKHFPEAVMNGMLRPFPWEMSKLWMLPMSAESLLIPAFIFLSVRGHKNNNSNDLFFRLWIIIAMLGIFALIGYTTPVLGAIVRYKMPGILLFLLVLLPASKQSVLSSPRADIATTNQ